MPYHQIKVGNIVQYVGRLNEHFNRNAMVISVEPSEDKKDSFMLRIKNWKGEEKDIWAYHHEVWPIGVEPAHLEKLGFARDVNNIFMLEGYVLVRPAFIKGELHALEFIDKGFVVVEKKIELPIEEEPVNNIILLELEAEALALELELLAA